MNRRGFLQGILAACVAPAVITTPGLLMPVRSIVTVAEDALAVGDIVHVNGQILTVTQITTASLAILHQKLNFISCINRQYDAAFDAQAPKIGHTVQIRLPQTFSERAA